MNDPIEIVCAADERFAMPLAVMLCSAATHSSKPLRAFVLNTDLSAKSKQNIQSACARCANPVKIVWIDADQNYLRNQPLGLSHLSQATYLRLAMGHLLPLDVERVIYLDSDVLVVGDLAPLWETSLQGKIAGAVRDFMTPITGQSNALAYCLKETGIPADHTMFNAGILLINLEAYRLQNIEAECLCFLKRWRSEIQSADQDAINAVLHGRIQSLDFEWNLQISSWNAFKQNASLTVVEQKALSTVNPVILHFSGQNKPWNSGLRSSHVKTYVKCVNQTGWYGNAGFRVWQAKRLAACVQTAAVNRFAAIRSKQPRVLDPLPQS